ncbi:MAG: amino acid ABC transporter substrate-binding protein [Betaproteobacteria bacterium]|nr:MAG: amino acid ABC transporter substrate-binding protein [Betaproteobacteria bacterium]
MCILLAATPTFAETSRTLDRIRADGVIHLGYRSGAAPFSFKERDGSVRGYSVELCTRVASAIQKQLRLSKLALDWTPLDAEDRLDAVAKGRVDIECGTTTISLSRMERVDFSVPIFVDGATVVGNINSKLGQLSDLTGKKIAVIPGTTTETALKGMLANLPAKAEIVPVRSGAEGVAQVIRARVDAYAGDRIVLISLRDASAERDRLQLLDSDFSYEPYALAVGRDDPDFRLAVNRALVELYRSGEIDMIFYRWLGGLGRPGPLLHSMFYLNTLPE